MFLKLVFTFLLDPELIAMVNRSIEGDGGSSSYCEEFERLQRRSQRRRTPSPVLFGDPIREPSFDERDLTGFGSFVPATPEIGNKR